MNTYDDLFQRIADAREKLLENRIRANTVIINGRKYGMLGHQMRLIDLNKIPHKAFRRSRDGLVDALLAAPTVDAVPVVRCKDCKYWERDVIFAEGYCRGKRQGNLNWYCADGERKEGMSDGGNP